MKNKLSFIIAAIALPSILAPCRAASLNSGAAFLELAGSARAQALQGANTAGAGNLDSLVYNPGGLAALGRPQLALTHAEVVSGAQYDAIDYGHPFGDNSIGVSMTRLGVNSLDGRDQQGHTAGSLDAQNLTGGVTFSREFGSIAGAGATVKYLQSRLGNDTASTVAFDFGSVAKIPGRQAWLGLSVLNLGHGMRFINETDPLPLTIATGGAVKIGGILNLTLDIKRAVHDGRTDAVAGMEYAPMHGLTLRGGYLAPLALSNSDQFSAMGNLRGGIGIQFRPYQIDYAIAPFGDIGFTHRFTLSAAF